MNISSEKKKDKEPLRIQLAIQGGGAKVVGLVAALEVLQRREAAGELKVTRIAATSAGAVAGALYAARVSMTTVKEHLRNFDASPFKPPSRLRAAWRLWRNRPIFDPRPLRASLLRLFDNGALTAMTLKQFAENGYIPLHITATDVTNSQLHTLGPADSRSLIEAILDSAAVPFLFRMPTRYDSGSVIADGGICENLPVAPLKPNEATDGPIVAISFAPGSQGKTPPIDLLGYLGALASAAIDNSVEKAKQGLRAILELRLDVPSFDFERSLRAGLDKYDLLKEQADSFFEKFITEANKQHIKTDPWSASAQADNVWERELNDAMQQIGWMYHVQHLPRIPRISRSQLVVAAYSLERTNKPDAVTNTVILHAKDYSVNCYRFALTGATDRSSLLKSEITVTDSHGNAVAFRKLPMMDFGGSARARSLLVMFQTPLTRENGPYTVRLTEQVDGFFAGLLDGRHVSEAYISTRLAGLDRAQIVVHYPRQVDLKAHGEVMSRSADGQQEEECTVACKCQRIPPGELALHYHPPSNGFLTVGWTCESVPVSSKFAVHLYG